MRRPLHRLSFITAVILASGLQGLAQADPVTLNTTFPGRGWFAETGLHDPLTDNTYTGISCCPNGINLNSFFIWDVQALAGKQVTSAVLRLGQDFQTQAGLETVEIHDVLSSRSALIAGYDPRDMETIIGHPQQTAPRRADELPRRVERSRPGAG